MTATHASRQRILIIGAGGHGRVVADVVRQSGHTPVGFLDDDPALQHTTVCGVPVLGPVTDLAATPHEALFVAIGDNATRERMSEQLTAHGEVLAALVHPAAMIGTDVSIGPGAIVAAGAVVAPGSRIGRGCILNSGCVIEHDTHIGDWAHVASGTVLGGGVTIGRRALVGLGARVLPRSRVGDDAIVGAAALVVADIPDRVVCSGVPARVTRQRE